MSMNSKINVENKIQELFLDILSPKSFEDKITTQAQMIHLDLIHEIRGLMQLKEISSKKELAERLNTTSSYITQLFSGEKLVNLKLLAKLQLIFDTKFNIVPEKSYAMKKNFQEKIHEKGYLNKYGVDGVLPTAFKKVA